jgi:hypothetical protein
MFLVVKSRLDLSNVTFVRSQINNKNLRLFCQIDLFKLDKTIEAHMKPRQSFYSLSFAIVSPLTDSYFIQSKINSNREKNRLSNV